MYVALVLATVLISAFGGVTAASEYEISLEDGFDTPNQEVELEGNTFTVRGVAGVSTGETITASFSGPEDASRVYIYGTQDGERVIMDQKSVDGDSSVSFDTSGYDAGSYAVTLYADNDYRAVYPFVVRGAEISTTVPDSVTQGQELTVDASVSEINDDLELTGVEFVLTGSETSERIDATADGDQYTGSFSTDELESGEYRVYAIAQNDSQAPTGDQELVGLSTPQPVSITEQETTEEPSNPGNGGGGTGGQGSGGTGATTATSTPDPNTTTTPSTPGTTTPPSTNTTTSETLTHSSTTSGQSASTPETTATPDNVIEPNSETPTTTTTSTPGFTIVGAVIALGSLILLVRP